MNNLTYTSVKEMVDKVNDMFENGQYVSDGWQENDMYVLEIAQGGKDKDGYPIPTANITIKLPMPE